MAKGVNRHRPPAYEVYKARLQAYQQAKESYDETRSSEYTTANGWHIDDYEQDLPAEAPGLPEKHGSFAAAQNVLRNYSFPPPSLITGIFVPGEPLSGRVMALRARFLVFTFWFGVRVNRVVAEIQTLPDGEHEAVWGYSYRTLEGHFEQGQIDFTVHKQLSTGAVTFKIHAVSKTGFIRNPFYRLGFRLFGRILQRRFAHESLRRTLRQVEEMLRSGAPWPAEDEQLEVVTAEQVPDQFSQKVQQAADQIPKKPVEQ